MRYVTLAYGTRDEIRTELRNAASGQRSERRKIEAQRALRELDEGDDSVTSGNITYLVEDNTEPKATG
jgi:hypothetical protein